MQQGESIEQAFGMNAKVLYFRLISLGVASPKPHSQGEAKI
jgi:hypothetical protein